MARKTILLLYAVGAYFLATAALVYLMGFLADFWVPKGISDGPQIALWPAVAIDAGLICLFGLHHSITARAAFKRWWTTIIPAPIERATYLYMTALMTGLLVHLWQPIPVTVWLIEAPLWSGTITLIYIGIWTMMSAATFHFGHFSFFGLMQAWQNFREAPPVQSNMTARYLYALVRHPISLGWMTPPLATPHLTIGHLVFAGATVIYILLATPFEEADLIDEIGKPYREYRKQVPIFVPLLKTNKSKPFSPERH